MPPTKPVLALWAALFVAYVLTHHTTAVFGFSVVVPRAVRFWEPHLVLCSHDYEHVDLFTMAREAQRWHAETGLRTAFVVADRVHNHLFCAAVHQGGACIAVRWKTVQKVLAMLRTHVVVMFVYRGAPGTGAYHLHRSFPRVLVANIRTDAGARVCTLEAGMSVVDVVRAAYGRTFEVTYHAPPSPIDATADEYMANLKEVMYDVQLRSPGAGLSSGNTGCRTGR